MTEEKKGGYPMNYTRRDRALELRRDSFRSWLVTRHNAIVGSSSVEVACPLAFWLSDMYRFPCQVSFSAYQVEQKEYPLPSWASAFVYCLDLSRPLEYVTGEQALTLLDELGVVL